MKYWARTYYEGDVCVFNHASKSFQKCLENYVTNYFLKEIGEIFDPKEFSLSIPSKPVFNRETFETYAPKLMLGYFGHYGFECEIFWFYKDRKKELKLLDDIVEKDVEFILKPYVSVEYLKNQILDRAREKKEFYLDGYRFVVHLKKVEIDVRLKLKFDTIITKELVQHVTDLLGETIEHFNNSSNSQETGLIHSYRYISKTKEYVNFKLDLGSGSKEGVEAILGAFDKSDFPISKVEISKL
ncbi:hypothetical protein [uncultured Arcticibacterium sp.]|uniref:hypothetical protein n=1 Tax=uncultured Arcticibacterium sp. TaxID=2173042 RepID=UPI0030FC065B